MSGEFQGIGVSAVVAGSGGRRCARPAHGLACALGRWSSGRSSDRSSTRPYNNPHTSHHPGTAPGSGGRGERRDSSHRCRDIRAGYGSLGRRELVVVVAWCCLVGGFQRFCSLSPCEAFSYQTPPGWSHRRCRRPGDRSTRPGRLVVGLARCCRGGVPATFPPPPQTLSPSPLLPPSQAR